MQAGFSYCNHAQVGSVSNLLCCFCFFFVCFRNHEKLFLLLFPPPSLLHAVWRWIQSTRGVLAAMISGCYKYFVCSCFVWSTSQPCRSRPAFSSKESNQTALLQMGWGARTLDAANCCERSGPVLTQDRICWCDPLVFCGEIAPPLPRRVSFSFSSSPSLPFSPLLSLSLSLSLSRSHSHTFSTPRPRPPGYPEKPVRPFPHLPPLYSFSKKQVVACACS